MLDSLTVLIDTLAAGSLQNPGLALPVYALAGLASSLFPCIYPLIPITVGILQKRTGESEARWKHPLFYWLGTILAYGILGVLAAAGGGAFNLLMQNGVVILLTGFLFLFLAFVMMDWHPLSFTGSGNRLFQSASRRSGFFYTTLMGVGAGLVASACVAPALVTMLLFIAQSESTGHFLLNLGYGGILSASFGVGIGVPFFLAGILGSRLARPGRWMNYVKVSFALLIVLAALYQIHKGFFVLGYANMEIYTILLGLGLIALAAILGLRPPATSDRPALTRFLFALFALALGAGAVVRGVGWGAALSSPPEGTVEDKKQEETWSREEWKRRESKVEKEVIAGLIFYRDETFARQKAKAEGRALFVDFYADWCTNCKDFYRLVERDSRLKGSLSRAVILKIKDTDPVFPRYQEDPAYPELNIGLPFFLVFAPDGSLHWRTSNYRDREGMIRAIQEAAPSSRDLSPSVQ